MVWRAPREVSPLGLSLLVVSLLVVWGPAPSAAAETPSEPLSEAEAELQAWVREELPKAWALHTAKQYREAIAAYQRLYARSPEPRFLLNIGVAYAEMGDHCVQVVEAFERFEKTCGSCPQRREGLERWAGLRPQCEAKLTLVSEPPGAMVQVDGRRLGPAPQVATLLAGEHVVLAELEGHRPAQRALRVEGPQARTVTLELETQAAPAPGGPPMAGVAVGSGGAATRRDGATWRWVALGVGVAGIAAGATFTVLAHQAADEVEEARTRKDAVDALDRRDTSTTMQWVGYGVGAAGLVTAATLWWLDDAEPTTAWQPIAGPSGLGLVGRF